MSDKVQLFVLIGEVKQIERYTIKKVEGCWRIDSQKIQEDHVIRGNTWIVLACFTA